MPGFNFRDTLGFVTDGTGESFVFTVSFGGTYPTTYGNGITAGYEGPGNGMQTRDRDNSLDRRLAGMHFINQPGPPSQFVWRMDLPSTGSYDVVGAWGDPSIAAGDDYVEFRDTNTVIATPIDDNNGHPGGQWYDATGVLRTSASDWVNNNAAASLTFSTTIFRVATGRDPSAGFCAIAHLAFESATPSGDISGGSNGAATVSGSLSGLGALSGSSDGIATIAAILSGLGALSGTSNGIATVSGNLLNELIQGIAQGLATVTGNLTGLGALSGSSDGLASTLGVLTGIAAISGQISSIATTDGVLVGLGALAGVVNGLATASGVLGAIVPISGSSNGLATVSGSLTYEGQVFQIIKLIAFSSKPFGVVYFIKKPTMNFTPTSY